MSKSNALATSRNMEQRQKLRTEYTSKLEVESQRMEDRLKMLKTMLAAEKSRRNADGGIHWKSMSSTQSPKKPIGQKIGEGESPKPVRVRVLTNREGKNKAPLSSSKPCGQCDKNSASLSCVECVENYCQVCFVKIHQKGALANHHVKPFMSKMNAKPEKKTVTASTTTTSGPVEMKQISSCVVGTENDGNSLLNGSYDETSSAASFQQALTEWRAGKKEESKNSTASTGANTDSTKATTTATSTSTSTGSENIISKKQKKVEISFSSDTGVSYLEKLMTRRSRYDPTLLKKIIPKPATASVSPVHDSSDHEDMEYVPTRYNIFYEADDDIDIGDFSAEDCEELSRPMSTVQIKEITEPLIQDIHVESAEPASLPPTVKTSKSKKRDINPQKYKVSSSRKRSATGTRPKSTTKRPSSKSLSRMSDPDLQSGVQKAWADCSKKKQTSSKANALSRFFLQGVESQTTASTNSDELNVAASMEAQFDFAATIWLPFNSIAADSEHLVQTAIEPGSDSDTDDNEPPLTDLPSRCNSAFSTHSQSLLETGQIAERQEWDEEDSKTLESLASELISTIESEGQLSRCVSVLDSIDCSTTTEDRLSEGDSDVTVEPVDMGRVVSQFELYQQQLLDEEI